VCTGKLSIQQAQRRMVTDWYKYYLQETGSAAVSAQSTATAQTSTAADVSEPEVKKSSTSICHEKGTTYYAPPTGGVGRPWPGW
jgi:hypothetical protein